jgi:hypothetical protein
VLGTDAHEVLVERAKPLRIPVMHAPS